MRTSQTQCIKQNAIKVSGIFTVAAAVLVSAMAVQAEMQRVTSPPAFGTFWSMQKTNQPPLPYLPTFLGDLPVYEKGFGAFWYDDRGVDYGTVTYPVPAGMAVGDMVPSGPQGPFWGPDDLWLEIQLDPNWAVPYVDLILHGTTVGLYQWLGKSDLSVAGPWIPGEVINNQTGADTMFFTALPALGPMRFFRAVGGDTVVSIRRPSYQADAVEPLTDSPSEEHVVGHFELSFMPALERPLTVVYTVFGSASNGVDYTELSGVLEVPTNSSSAQITVDPIYDTELEFEESVTVSLVLTNGYLVQRDQSTATIFISDRIDTNVFTVVASNVPSPVEIQYHQPTDSLLLSVNYDTSGAQGNFLRLDSLGHSNGWSSVSELYEEVKFAVPRTTANGWTNGCMFFGRETQIAYLSEDAAEVVPTWCTLTNEVVTNALYLRGSLCFDETGVWSNDLIVATSDNTPDSTTRKGVWCVDAKGTPKLIANIATDHLEGVISIPNDPARWGPWAGKILTGDESLKDENSKSTPLLYAVDMSGKTTTYNLGIQAEDFDLIPADQDLYCVNFNNYQSKVLKISRNLLSNFVGDLLITQAGEYNLPPSLVWAPKLFIVHWDGANFVTRSITLPSDTFPGTFEHVTFAPVALPNL